VVVDALTLSHPVPGDETSGSRSARAQALGASCMCSSAERAQTPGFFRGKYLQTHQH
jgi:hypothetical protein